MVENFDDVSEEEEEEKEDVKPLIAHKKAKVNKKDSKAKAKKKNRAAKRKRFEKSIEKVEKKIKDVANRIDQRMGHMIMDVVSKLEDYKRMCLHQMGSLITKVEELKHLISQVKGTKESIEPSIEIIVLETSSSNASD